MTAGVALDLVLVLALALHAVAMYRVGLVTSALSVLGLLAGGLLALWGLPGVIDRLGPVADDPLLRTLSMVVGVVVVAGLGQQLGGLLGVSLRGLVRLRLARHLDSVLGAASALVVGAVLVWLAAGAVVAALPAPPEVITSSRVVQGIDRVMPAGADKVMSNAYRSLGPDGLPRVFTGVGAEPIMPVDPPSADVVRGRGIEAAAASVVRVAGQAECGRGQTGSGWVAAPGRIVTNAHVVAGVDHPSVQVGGTGPAHDATVVAFDPRRDVAVLAVPGLDAPALPTGPAPSRGDDVVVAGFPLGGPYDLEPGRVRSSLEARGAGIDGSTGVVRDIYSVNVLVEHGNSGGPLLTPAGQVVGTVFATSRTHDRTGYVLTLDETRSVIAQGTRSTTPVPTGACVS